MSLSLPLEPSLTAANLCTLLGDVKKWGSDYGIPVYLQIPRSKVKEMEQLYPDLSQRQSALIQLWLNQHPAPSWELICWALYRTEEYEVLENVQHKYLKGIVPYNIILYVHCIIYSQPLPLRGVVNMFGLEVHFQ